MSGDPRGNDLGANLRELRHARGISQGELARMCGSHCTWIRGLERGQIRNPGVFTLYPLALALGCRLETLMGVSPLEASTRARVKAREAMVQ